MYSYTSSYQDEELFIPKGRVIGGNAIGIIAPTAFWNPVIPGSTGNLTTFNFPVHYKFLEADTSERSIIDLLLTTKPDAAFLEQTIKAAKELEEQGCRAIIGVCGFFANYLTEVATAVNVPTFISSLMQIPIISCALGPSQKVGVITANGRVLSSASILKNCGVNDLSTVVIAGAEDLPEMQNILQCTGHLNPAKLEQELVGLVKQTVSENPDIGAILLECGDFPPYAWAVQKAVRLPVFDFTTMINWVYDAVVRRPFAGFM